MGREAAKEVGARHILRGLAFVGIVRDLEPVPEAVLAEGRRVDAAKERR